MRVQATRQGFYGIFREAGDIFDIAKDEDFSDVWMQDPEKAQDEASKGPIEQSASAQAAVIDQDMAEEKSQAKPEHAKQEKHEHKTARKNPFKRSPSVDL